WIDPRAGVLFKIDFAEKTAVLLHELVDLVRDLALVKSVPPFLADRAQRLRERRIFENVAFRGRAVFPVECIRFKKSAGQIFVEFWPEVPLERKKLGNRKTL